MAKDKISIEIVYAEPNRQILLKLTVNANITIKQAIQQAKILERLAPLSIDALTVGIFGKLKSLDTILQQDDRVEIYRTLTIDPKEARRIKAKQRPLQKSKNPKNHKDVL